MDTPMGIRSRCLGVWALATAACAGLLRLAAASLAPVPALLRTEDTGARSFAEWLEWLAATTVAGCAAWLWVVVTVVTLSAARGRGRAGHRGAPPALRRLVLAACGLALAGGVTAPAQAVDAGGRVPHPAARVVQGLPLPERAEAPAHGRRDDTAAGRRVVVAPGDTLWSLAAGSLPADAADADVARRWHRIYALNRAVVGSDPDLIRPGQRLRLPEPRR
jgi:hypothetical protein